jgi:hypothetical protein
MAFRIKRPMFKMTSTTEFHRYTFYGSYLDDAEMREELNAPPDCRVIWSGITFHTTTKQNAESILLHGPLAQESEITGSVFGFHRETLQPAFWCSAIPLDIPREVAIPHLDGQELVTLGVQVSWYNAYAQLQWEDNWPCIQFALQPEDVDAVVVLDDWKRFRSPEALERLETLR